MDQEMARLRLAEGENEPVKDQYEIKEIEHEFQLCLVEKALTNSVVHFPSVRNVLAKL